MIDREGIRKLMLVYGKGRLCHEFGITAPTFRKYMKGKEPHHVSISEHINRKIKDMLMSKPTCVAALESYVDNFANHRLSIEYDNGAIKVLRYPIAHCWQRWDVASSSLWVHKMHFNNLMKKRHDGMDVLEDLENLGCVTGIDKFDLLEQSGMKPQRQTVNIVFDLCDEHMSKVLEILKESAKREEPDQDGRVYPS